MFIYQAMNLNGKSVDSMGMDQNGLTLSYSFAG